MNNVNLIGRLTQDLELRHINDETAVVNFTLAVDNRFKSEGEADFIRCVAFGKTAEVISEHTGKGVKIGVSGRLQTGSYDHKDGYTIYTTDVVVSEFTFCERKAQEEKPQEKQTYYKSNTSNKSKTYKK
jgi:single-strand DNA-binding protein